VGLADLELAYCDSVCGARHHLTVGTTAVCRDGISGLCPPALPLQAEHSMPHFGGSDLMCYHREQGFRPAALSCGSRLPARAVHIPSRGLSLCSHFPTPGFTKGNIDRQRVDALRSSCAGLCRQ